VLSYALALLVGLVLMASAGCSSDSALAPERTWEEVRYHWTESGDSYYGDAVVHATGEVQWDLQGTRVPARGLLAGENLETLTRLIGALPPAGYRSLAEPEAEERSFLTVRVGEETRMYSMTARDTGAPSALREIGGRFETWAETARVGRRDPIAHRILASGERSDVRKEAREIIQNRDEMLSVLTRLGPGQPGILPAVDFRREFVVAIFVGERPTGGFAVTVDRASRTEGGQIVIEEMRGEPDPACAWTTQLTAPFVLVAIEGPRSGDILFETDTAILGCGDRVSTQ
jgi:hypothetical protein